MRSKFIYKQINKSEFICKALFIHIQEKHVAVNTEKYTKSNNIHIKNIIGAEELMKCIQ